MLTLFRSLFAPPRHLILLLAALWLGLTLSEKRVGRHGISKDALNNMVYYSLLGYVVGGRVLFVLANLSAFTQSPLSIFSLNIDLFDPMGALATAILVGFVYGQRQNLSLWSTLDALTPLFATLAIGLSLSHLAAGTAFGRPTNLPWGIDLWNAARHPTQIYELIACDRLQVRVEQHIHLLERLADEEYRVEGINRLRDVGDRCHIETAPG
jgi:phosphatidylglycerol---prolipoprotein diacylglyceryl transferase